MRDGIGGGGGGGGRNGRSCAAAGVRPADLESFPVVMHMLHAHACVPRPIGLLKASYTALTCASRDVTRTELYCSYTWDGHTEGDDIRKRLEGSRRMATATFVPVPLCVSEAAAVRALLPLLQMLSLRSLPHLD